ncbi:MAG: FAD-binding protein [Tannerella sp.]|jgi:uncharacterized FAD-dependent dehydrogenase|nr:FAD-binding protein [Tannerella sp.]
MIKEIQLRLQPSQAANEQTLREVACRETGCEIRAVRVLKRSIDARQRTIYVNVSLRLFINEEPEGEAYTKRDYRDVSGAKQVIVVGAGPAGLFAALRLIELGLKPVIIERGKDVHSRKMDIARLCREHKVDSESNYCFGEGGAGAFSDGKLYTRSKKRGSVERILNIFRQHGADTSILADAHPHIGTDKLPRIIENIRNTILQSGGEVHFSTCMSSLIISSGEVVGVLTRDGSSFMGQVILATGHSARDVYRSLAAQNVAMETKDIAVGVRLEHPQMLIDQIRYHSSKGRGDYLPAAEYSFVAQSGERGVYSFCMCPGGIVVPSATAQEEVVVNGMSSSSRNSQWANAGIVVEVKGIHETKFAIGQLHELHEEKGTLAMMEFQEELERLAWINGGMRQTAPAQRMVDFVQKRNSSDLPVSSYVPGLLATPLHFWLPEFITSRLREGFRAFDRVSPGFLTNEAVMIGVETRTSAPVRILRDKDTLQNITFKGLFPCGEGAGYAGGIVSAAIDGELCAETIAKSNAFSTDFTDCTKR